MDPKFVIYTVQSTIWAVERGTYVEDQNIGEMLLNFIRIEVLWPFCGVGEADICTEEY